MPAPAHLVMRRSKPGDHHQERADAGAERASQFGAQLMRSTPDPLAHGEQGPGDSCPVPDLRGRTVLLVDEGMATGTTRQAALATLRPYQPARVIVAIPAASALSCQKLCTQADALVCLQIPRFPLPWTKGERAASSSPQTSRSGGDSSAPSSAITSSFRARRPLAGGDLRQIPGDGDEHVSWSKRFGEIGARGLPAHNLPGVWHANALRGEGRFEEGHGESLARLLPR